MYASRATLAKAGYLYPSIEKSHRFITSTFLDDPFRFDYNKASGLSNDQIQERNNKNMLLLESQLQASGCRNLILSSEHLVILTLEDVRRLKAYLDKRFNRIVIILYLRHPLSAVGSFIQEIVKNGARRLHDMSISPPFSRAKHILSTWGALFEPQSFTIRDMNVERLVNRDLIDDFLFCIEKSNLSMEVTRIRANESLSQPAVMIADQITDLYPKYSVDRAPQRKLNQILVQIDGPRYIPSEEILKATHMAAQPDLEYLSKSWAMELIKPKEVQANDDEKQTLTIETLRSFAKIVNDAAFLL
jgi:hypothetical protein